jgi:hypothetical protein
MAVKLLDSFGRPITAFGYSAQGLYESATEDGTRLDRPNLNLDIAILLSRVKFRALISDSRYIASTFPLVQGGVQQKSHYVSQAGFTPVFTGKNKGWGRIARAALIQAHRVIDVRGGLFHWNKNWQIGCTMFDIDGSFFVVRGETDTGYPQLQFLEAHRIGSRYGSIEDYVTKGPYQGLRILNGIIYNENGREVAYRVLGATAELDRDISAMDMHHVAAPRWYSDGRPFPSIAYSILDWYDAKEARGFQRTKQKVNSAITLVETNATGKAPADPYGNATDLNERQRQPAIGTKDSPVDPVMRMIGGGLIRYVKAGSGNLQSHADNTPGNGWLQFDERIVAGAFVGMDWRAEMLNLSAPGGGALTRAFADQINTSLYSRWGDLIPHVYQDEMYILRKLIKRGDVPDNEEWMKWGYVPPAEFTVDGGRSAKTDIEAVLAGTDALQFIVGRYGKTMEDIYRAQAEDVKLREEIAKEEGVEVEKLGSPDKIKVSLSLGGSSSSDNPPNVTGGGGNK